MQQYSGDRDVFIRSMAARGHAGGLASTTGAACAVLDAAGFDLVLVETVGTGQSEVEVASSADTTVVLEAPEMGDEVQAIKAGLLEVADIVVVNKGDRPGRAADRRPAPGDAGRRAQGRRPRRSRRGRQRGGAPAAETARSDDHHGVHRRRRAGAARRARPTSSRGQVHRGHWGGGIGDGGHPRSAGPCRRAGPGDPVGPPRRAPQVGTARRRDQADAACGGRPRARPDSRPPIGSWLRSDGEGDR